MNYNCGKCKFYRNSHKIRKKSKGLKGGYCKKEHDIDWNVPTLQGCAIGHDCSFNQDKEYRLFLRFLPSRFKWKLYQKRRALKEHDQWKEKNQERMKELEEYERSWENNDEKRM